MMGLLGAGKPFTRVLQKGVPLVKALISYASP